MSHWLSFKKGLRKERTIPGLSPRIKARMVKWIWLIGNSVDLRDLFTGWFTAADDTLLVLFEMLTKKTSLVLTNTLVPQLVYGVFFNFLIFCKLINLIN